jgi:hypothetical protein
MNDALFAELDLALAEDPAHAARLLCERLRSAGDAAALFYALLMQARHRLGVAPTPTRPSEELPADVHEAYEAAIRDAGRAAGRACLDAGDIPRAWGFFRMLGEPEAVRDALERYDPPDDADLSPYVDIALQQGVHPRRGFEWVLDRQGVCAAITAVATFGHQMAAGDRVACVGRLVRTLHDQVAAAVGAAVAAREGAAPARAGVAELIAGRDWLFGDECYFVDVSHLAAVVQMSLELPGGPELDLARSLAAFGARLPERFRLAGPAPFDEGYADYAAALAVVAGDGVYEHLEHFRRKAERAQPDDTAAAELYVNLLLKADRPRDALAAAQTFVLHADDRRLSCPGVYDLAHRLGDFPAMAAAARERGDAVHYLAARLEALR